MEEAPGSDSAAMARTSTWAEQSLDALTTLPGVRRAGIALVEGGGRRLSFTAAERPGDRPVTWCHIDAYDDVPLNTAVRSGRAVVGTLDQLRESHAEFVDRQAGTGSVALAALPLVADHHVLGGFVLFYDDEPAPGAAAVRDLHVIGARLAEALHEAQGPRAAPPACWAGAAPQGAQVVQFTVAADPAAVGSARRDLRHTLAAWDVDTDAAETAALCLSELVTNAVVHAASGCWVHVTHHDGTLTVAVRNAGPQSDLPEPGVSDPLRVHGRGLQLVDALATRWGFGRDRAGFTAWFALNV